MSPATLSTLPAELHDIVLDLLVDDRKTLKACCLTWKLWLPRAQHNLHRQVAIDQRNSKTIRSMLFSRPHLATWIRELTLQSVDATCKPPKCLQLPALKRLQLVDVDLADPWVLATGAPSVQELSLRDCTAVDDQAFLDFIGRFSRLVHLNLERCRSESHGPPLSENVRLPTLISCSFEEDKGDFFRTVKIVPTLLKYPASFRATRILDIRISSRYFIAFNNFLREVGPGLRDLKIQISSEEDPTRE